ncbi:MAG TPA: hypothetical protein VGF86_04605 [Candidatus Tumulicola sp.]
MPKRRDLRHRAVAVLLHGLRSRRALARSPFVAQALRAEDPAQLPARRAELAAALPEIIAGLVDELAAESEQSGRRFEVLQRSDVAREPHAVIARDVGLSRSQFYRDLQSAREALAHALEERLGAPGGAAFEGFAADPRFVAIDALRDSGQYERACAMATLLARNAGAADAVRALCVRADLETESGLFAAAGQTAREARTLLPGIADDRLRDILDAGCDLAEFEAAHCAGSPAARSRRVASIEQLRRSYRPGDREYAALLVKALIGESSLLFGQGDPGGALGSIDEASAIVAREGLGGSRLGVDVRIRASGIAALHADRVGEALERSAEIADAGARNGDARTLRVGMQMMSAHLLTLGRLDEAKHYALEAWALIDLFGSALDRAIVLSNLARIDIHRRDGVAALHWIGFAQRVPCDAFPITQALAISQAEAFVLVDHAERAVELARAANARVRAWPRLLGRAKLAEATALSALERAPEARRCSAQAIELAHGNGGPLLELRALDLDVRLTGSAKSLHALRELQAALSV